MEKVFTELSKILQNLVHLHQELRDSIYVEKKALLEADLMRIQESAFTKQFLIETICAQESLRLKTVETLAAMATLGNRIHSDETAQTSLTALIALLGDTHSNIAQELKKLQRDLSELIEDTLKQNQNNFELLEQALQHVQMMKQNILENALPQSYGYTHHGKKSTGLPIPHMISKEA